MENEKYRKAIFPCQGLHKSAQISVSQEALTDMIAVAVQAEKDRILKLANSLPCDDKEMQLFIDKVKRNRLS